MKDIIVLFTDLNEFNYKRELLFRYVNSTGKKVNYFCLTNKKYGRVNKFYSNRDNIISLGYKENIDRKFVKNHLEEIIYFLQSYNFEKILFCDKELDLLSKYQVIAQKIDETYYESIYHFEQNIRPIFCEKNILIDYSYRNNITPFEINVINKLIDASEFKINLLVRKDDKKMFEELFQKKVKLYVKKDFFEEYVLKFDLGIVFSKDDVLSLLDYKKAGLLTCSFDPFFKNTIRLTYAKCVKQLQNLFDDIIALDRMKIESK